MNDCDEEMKEKLKYCLNCKVKPCQKGCPLGNDIPSFIKATKEDNIEEAYHILTQTTVLGSICGRICPHQKQCQGSCIRGIKGASVSIGELEAYVFDQAQKQGIKMKQQSDKLKGKTIAVLGGGPAGLTASAFLARNGAQVTIFDKQPKLGGILRYGIPEFRLSKKVLDKLIEQILALGVQVEYKMKLEDKHVLNEIKDQFDVVLLTFGANISTKMGIEGEKIDGVFGGNELLERGHHPSYTEKKVAVIGGGNVAMDAARTIKKLGADEVFVVYRRAEKQMPAEKKEIEDAKREGIQFLFQHNVTKIVANEQRKVQSIECIKTDLIKKEGEDREVPINKEGSNYNIDMDYVIMAVGSQPDALVSSLGLELTRYGYVKVNEIYQTSDKKIFAAGDLIGSKSTVAWAARGGREAAYAILNYLTQKN